MFQKIILTVLISLGIFLRIYNLSSVPSGLFSDEIALGINAKTIAQNLTDEFGNILPFGFESFGDYKMPGYIYFDVLFHKFLPQDILTIRLPAIIASVLSVFALGYLAFLLFPEKKQTGFLAALALALMPYHIQFGRIAYETMLATFFLIIYLIAFVKLLKETKRAWVWIIAGSISVLISSWTYQAPKFIIPVFTGLALLLGIFSQDKLVKKRNIVLTCFFFLGVSLLSLVPTFLNPQIDQRPLSYVLGAKPGNVLISYLRIWNPEFLFAKGDLFGFRHGTGGESGLLLPIFIIPLFYGFYYFFKNIGRNNFSLVLLGILTIVCGLPSALTSIMPYGPRLLPITIPMTIIIGLGLSKIIDLCEKHKIICSISLIILFYQLALFSHLYLVHYRVKSLPEFPKASVDVAKYVAQEAKNNPQRKFYFLNGKECWPWVHDELKLWYFADLNNNMMIEWNNLYRDQREKSGSLFAGFGSVTSSRFEIENIILNSGWEEMENSKSGSVLIRCGLDLNSVNAKKEKTSKIFYMYEREKRDPVYIVTKKI